MGVNRMTRCRKRVREVEEGRKEMKEVLDAQMFKRKEWKNEMKECTRGRR